MTTILAAMINAILNIILIPRFGVQGAAIATAVSYGAMWLIRIIVLKKYIKLKISWHKDVIVYSLLAVQVILEHSENHLYICQLLCVLLIFMIYKDSIITIGKMILEKISRWRNAKNGNFE